MKQAGPIRLLVLDDHQIVRHGLISMLSDEPDIEVVAEARTAEEAIRLHGEHRPDLSLVDLRLPGLSGVAFIEQTKRIDPKARFLVLTTYDADEDIYLSFKAGANAYLLKDSFRSEILRAVRTVAAGGSFIPEAIARRLEERQSCPTLSPREVEVLRLVARGQSNKLIADALGLREGTVKTHLLNIYAKLGVSDRTAATTAAIARGIIRM